MSIAMICPNRDLTRFLAHMAERAPDIAISVWPDIEAPDHVEAAVVFKHPPGIFNYFKHLKWISSFGAGVDHILNDPSLPPHLPITRIVDHELPNQMRSYVVGAVLAHFRKLSFFGDCQRAKKWDQQFLVPLTRAKVGLMGFGAIGEIVGKALHDLQFDVSAWTRTDRPLPDWVEHHIGEKELYRFIATCDYVVCLLPLTAHTRGIFNRDLFRQMKRGAYVINVARGAHVNDDDLLAAVQSGHLSGACLDVFHQEPLAVDHPFWGEPRILMTPHIASISDPVAVADQVIENYRRLHRHEPLLHAICRTKGY